MSVAGPPTAPTLRKHGDIEEHGRPSFVSQSPGFRNVDAIQPPQIPPFECRRAIRRIWTEVGHACI
jgi:hypothetical protein